MSLYNSFRSLFVDGKANDKQLGECEGSLDAQENLIKVFYWILVCAVWLAFFLMLIDYVNLQQKDGKADLGPFGDFFGGVLNPILTFMTFFGLVVTIVIQRIELRLTRVEYEKTSSALKQTAMESIFFNTIDLHNKIADNIEWDFPYADAYRIKIGDDKKIVDYIEKNSNTRGRKAFSIILGLFYYADGHDKIKSIYRFFQDERNSFFGHYFRNLYQIIKLIDQFDINFSNKRKYSGILRAQLSADELVLLFINCLDGMVDSGEFKSLVIKYNLLEHMPIVFHDSGLYFIEGKAIQIADDDMINQYIERNKNGEIIGNAFGKRPMRIPDSLK